MKEIILLVVVALLIVIGVIGTIHTTAKAGEFDEFTIVSQEGDVTILLDRVTGNHYIMTSSGICPRLDMEGKPYREECE